MSKQSANLIGFSFSPPIDGRKVHGDSTIGPENRTHGRPRPSLAKAFKRWGSAPCGSMPEGVRASPMREENESQNEHRHEKKVLCDHDALLLLFRLTKNSVPLRTGERCDGRNI